MRISNILLLIFSLAMIGVSQTVKSPKQRTVVPGTRVSLVPPTGFTAAPQFPGFWQESNGSSIIVLEFSRPFTEALSEFANLSALAKEGMAILNKREVYINDESGLLVQLTHNLKGTEYRKWVLVFGDEKQAVMITATFPKKLARVLSAKMKASVLTAKWDREKTVASTKGLNFTITEKGELRLVKRIANSLTYTKSAVFPSKAIDDPPFIVAHAQRLHGQRSGPGHADHGKRARSVPDNSVHGKSDFERDIQFSGHGEL